MSQNQNAMSAWRKSDLAFSALRLHTKGLITYREYEGLRDMIYAPGNADMLLAEIIIKNKIEQSLSPPGGTSRLED